MPTFQGTTMQKAIDAGLLALGVARDQVTVDVIQEGKRGLLGFGKQVAIVNLNVIAPATPEPAPAAPVAEPAKHHLPHHSNPKRDDKTALRWCKATWKTSRASLAWPPRSPASAAVTTCGTRSPRTKRPC